MRHNNVSIFIPHIGCPNMCSFCNQHTISGTQKAPSSNEVKTICRQAFDEIKDKSNSEIAFFGGSFTAIPRDYMIELLESVQEFLLDDGFKGMRISTRPDCIDVEVLQILKNYGVTSIELGAQSMSNIVLKANDRGHTAEDVVKAGKLIREYGFELGLQMMMGLYKSTVEDEIQTVNKICEIHSDTVRIYPVVILKGTKLAELYQSGEYKTYSFEKIVDMTANAMIKFEENGIRVIKCGLHASEFVEKDMIGGFYHPAFRELCESIIYRNRIENKISEISQSNYIIAVNPSCISKALGHKKSNYEYFKNHGIYIKIVGDEKIPKYECEIRG